MDKTIAKTITKKEKILKKVTFSARFINLMMILAIIKWLIIFAILTGILFTIVKFKDNAPPIDLSFVGIDIKNISLSNISEGKTSLEETSLTGLINLIWLIPIIIFVIIFLPLILFYYQYYLRISNYYVFTDTRMIFKKGWLSTEVESIQYDHITDVMVSQSVWDKLLFGTGKIFISTAGREGYEAEMLNIAHPHHFKKEIFRRKEEYINKRVKK